MILVPRRRAALGRTVRSGVLHLKWGFGRWEAVSCVETPIEDSGQISGEMDTQTIVNASLDFWVQIAPTRVQGHRIGAREQILPLIDVLDVDPGGGVDLELVAHGSRRLSEHLNRYAVPGLRRPDASKFCPQFRPPGGTIKAIILYGKQPI